MQEKVQRVWVFFLRKDREMAGPFWFPAATGISPVPVILWKDLIHSNLQRLLGETLP